MGGASPQLESLRSEVRSKDTLIAEQNVQLESLREESEKMANQLAAIKDRLNVSEVTDLQWNKDISYIVDTGLCPNSY